MSSRCIYIFRFNTCSSSCTQVSVMFVPAKVYYGVIAYWYHPTSWNGTAQLAAAAHLRVRYY